MTAVMERSASLSNAVHQNSAVSGMSNSGGSHHGHHLILHQSSMSGSSVGNMSLDHHHPHHQQLISKQLNNTHHLLHPMHLTSPSSLPSSSASSIASSTTSTSPGLLLSSVLPIKKVGRRGRPPKKDAKSRNRQGVYLNDVCACVCSRVCPESRNKMPGESANNCVHSEFS